MKMPSRDDATTVHVLGGAEHAAMERLILASDISAAARVFLAETGDRGHTSGRHGAVTATLLLGPLVSKLGAALVASATHRPGGQAQLARASRDVEAALRELPHFPESHRLANVQGGRELIEDTLGDLLRDTALELHDIDIAYGMNEGGEHVFTWRQESQYTADVMLLEGLILKMELMLTAEPGLAFEHSAGVWWHTCHMPAWPAGAASSAGWRLREWALADRVIPGLGVTAAQALPHHELWEPLSARQRRIARAFAASTPGLFVVRAATPRGATGENAFDDRRYELIIEDPETPPGELVVYLGRLVPYDTKRHLASPGTISFRMPADFLDDVRAALRGTADRHHRGPAAELTVGRLSGHAPGGDMMPAVTPTEAHELVTSYERALAARRVGKEFRVPGARAMPPDEMTTGWLELLHRSATGG